jgi:hypothetical protein
MTIHTAYSPVIANAVKQSMRVHWIASPCGFAMTEGVTVIVIPEKITPPFSSAKREYDNSYCLPPRHCERSEAIHAGTLDCFTLRVRNDGGCSVIVIMEKITPPFSRANRRCNPAKKITTYDCGHGQGGNPQMFGYKRPFPDRIQRRMDRIECPDKNRIGTLYQKRRRDGKCTPPLYRQPSSRCRIDKPIGTYFCITSKILFSQDILMFFIPEIRYICIPTTYLFYVRQRKPNTVEPVFIG